MINSLDKKSVQLLATQAAWIYYKMTEKRKRIKHSFFYFEIKKVKLYFKNIQAGASK
ncbi:unnamed protein product [Meloidogyne enterolobii]|uniref:Uncharacterized protein n=1 Tax=Meloidogyne enterolobii TaxID=390850 RepID=A0ACB0ZZJ5_MELEN